MTPDEVTFEKTDGGGYEVRDGNALYAFHRVGRRWRCKAYWDGDECLVWADARWRGLQALQLIVRNQ